MKRPQIHLYLTPTLMGHLKVQASLWGLTLSQYVKFILVKDLGGSAIELNIRAASNKTRFEGGRLVVEPKQEIY